MLMNKKTLWRLLAGAAVLAATSAAQAQTDYSAYGVIDFSYGRFEPSGLEPDHRFNSNSMTATFFGVNLKRTFDGNWTPGITLESFYRIQDVRGGRRARPGCGRSSRA